MKKKILSFMMVLVLTCSVCMTALAEEEISRAPVQSHGGTAAELKSYGRIVYQKGTDTIKIDSEDLYMLADQIDQVKLDVTDQLEALNTYFSTGEGIVLSTSEDINVVHAKPYEEDFVDPLDVNFDTLLEGIAVSQSVSQDVTAYGYPAGTELFKTTKGLLTTDGSEKDAKQISVTAATADDLSAGMAAWVNGELLLGTGEGSQDYYNEGYDEGYSKGYANRDAAGCHLERIGTTNGGTTTTIDLSRYAGKNIILILAGGGIYKTNYIDAIQIESGTGLRYSLPYPMPLGDVGSQGKNCYMYIYTIDQITNNASVQISTTIMDSWGTKYAFVLY